MTPTKVADKFHQTVKDQLYLASAAVTGLPLAFTDGEVKWLRSYNVALVTPTGFVLDIGMVMFDNDTGKLLHDRRRATSPTLNAIVDRLSDKYKG